MPGLLDAARAPFDAAGLTVPWLAVHGNHDRLLQGTVPAVGRIGTAATESIKAIGLPAHLSMETIVSVIAGLAECDPAALTALTHAETRVVTPDPRRRIVTRAEFVAAHFGPAARPVGHGFAADGRPYYRYDHGSVTVLTLDTVDEFGGWQGSLDGEQFNWLTTELLAADGERRYVVLASHHPLNTLVNDRVADGAPRRILGPELATELARHPSVVLWLNGHSHQTAVTPHKTWWEVTAPSLIDWPQQARIVELLQGDGSLTIATTMLDHVGPTSWHPTISDPLALAGLSRELAGNDWQWRTHDLDVHPRAGQPDERNTLLHLPDPWRE